LRENADAFEQLILRAISNGVNFLISMRDNVKFHNMLPRGFTTVVNYTGHKQLGRIFCDGDNITIPGFSPKGPEQKIPPNSAATAITAGVASLILATRRLVQFSIDPNGSTPNGSVAKFLAIMEREMGGRTCLKPWRWFGEEPVFEMGQLRSILEKTNTDNDF
jgi:hypothetical protein